MRNILSNFSKKFFTVFALFFLVAFLFAKGPTKDFPYEYYTSSERDWSYYSSYCRTGKLLDDDSEWKVFLCKSYRTCYIVHKYKQGKEPRVDDLYKILKDHKSVYKTLDSKIDKLKGYDCDVCLVFLDCYNQLILSATYSEDYYGF